MFIYEDTSYKDNLMLNDFGKPFEFSSILCCLFQERLVKSFYMKDNVQHAEE